jgi:hypothetical protein
MHVYLHFKNNYSNSRVKSYSEIKYINSIKIGCVISGGGVMVPKWVYSCSATVVFLWCQGELVAR